MLFDLYLVAWVSTRTKLKKDGKQPSPRVEGSSFFASERLVLAEVGFVGERPLLPLVVKPRSPLPQKIKEEMQKEKEAGVPLGKYGPIDGVGLSRLRWRLPQLAKQCLVFLGNSQNPKGEKTG